MRGMKKVEGEDFVYVVFGFWEEDYVVLDIEKNLNEF
jgi:hypothetical protein